MNSVVADRLGRYWKIDESLTTYSNEYLRQFCLSLIANSSDVWTEITLFIFSGSAQWVRADTAGCLRMGVKKYLKNQFKVYKIYLEHEIASDFYLSSLQTSSSVWPLLCIRTVIFLGCLGILLWSAILTGMKIDFKYWPIYLTHWGLVINTVCSGLATVVSVAAYYQGSIGEFTQIFT